MVIITIRDDYDTIPYIIRKKQGSRTMAIALFSIYLLIYLLITFINRTLKNYSASGAAVVAVVSSSTGGSSKVMVAATSLSVAFSITISNASRPSGSS